MRLEQDVHAKVLSQHPRYEAASLEKYYHVEVLGEERVAGRNTVLIVIKPKDAYRYARRIYLDKETGLLLKSLLIDGVIAGVGGVLIFLPQIFILFFFVAILEDCGYMSRAAYLMDRLMSRVGLSGKSFIPLIFLAPHLYHLTQTAFCKNGTMTPTAAKTNDGGA